MDLLCFAYCNPQHLLLAYDQHVNKRVLLDACKFTFGLTSFRSPIIPNLWRNCFFLLLDVILILSMSQKVILWYSHDKYWTSTLHGDLGRADHQRGDSYPLMQGTQRRQDSTRSWHTDSTTRLLTRVSALRLGRKPQLEDHLYVPIYQIFTPTRRWMLSSCIQLIKKVNIIKESKAAIMNHRKATGFWGVPLVIYY